MPRVDREGFLADHDCSSSARSVTTTSAPLRRKFVGLAHPVDAHHVAEVTGTAGLYARQCVLEHGRRVGGDVEQLRPAQVRVGGRLAGDVLFAQRDAVHPLLDEPV